MTDQSFVEHGIDQGEIVASTFPLSAKGPSACRRQRLIGLHL
jgi:hypothetical protein